MTRDGWILLGAGVLWAGSVGYGMKALSEYRYAPGPAARASEAWPSGSGIRRAGGRATLVMLAHPHCPCTRASINELNGLMHRLNGALSTVVLFVKPPDFPEGWERTDSWTRAGDIPGVEVRLDPEGREAKRFGGNTSGEVFVYDAGGRLLYSGGITSGRGHEGDNDGLRDVIALVTGAKAGPVTRSAFGCVLFGSTDKIGGDA